VKSPTEKLPERAKTERVRGSLTLDAIVDPELSDRQARILALIQAHGGPVPLFFSDIAKALHCSRRKIIRAIMDPAMQSWLNKKFNGVTNVYSVRDNRAKRMADSCPCADCHVAGRATDKSGTCAVCRKRYRAEAEVGEFLRRSPGAALEIVYLGLKANCSKCGPREIKAAYLKLRSEAKTA
jgi:hypothetical protein